MFPIVSFLFDKFLVGSIGVSTTAATTNTLGVPNMQVGRTAVDIVFNKWRVASQVVWVESLSLLACLSGHPLLGKLLVLHQVGIAGVFTTLWLWQGILHKRQSTGESH